MKFVDSHCHIDFPEFDDDRESVLQQAFLTGLSTIVVPGVNAANWSRQQVLASQFPQIKLAFGIHPYFLGDFAPTHIERLEALLISSDCVAVGECGIDASIEDIEKQSQVFRQQVQLANQYQLPVIVHHRKSHHHIFSVFKQVKPMYGGVIHAFSGNMQDAQKYLELGFKLGCGGVISYPRAQKTRAVFQQVPLDAIVLETDAPDMPLSGYQGKRNEPKQVKEVAKVLAELRNLDIKQVAQLTSCNTKELFNLK